MAILCANLEGSLTKIQKISGTTNSQIFLDALFFLPKSQINDTHFTTVAESRFTFIKNVNFYNSLLWVHPLKIFEASYGTVTSDEIPSPMWDLILKGFKRNPTWAFEENKKKTA